MTAPVAATAVAGEAAIARMARRQARQGQWPPVLAEALVLLDAQGAYVSPVNAPGLSVQAAGRLWALAGLGVTWQRALAEAQRHSGRRVVATVFAMHATLRGQPPSDGGEAGAIDPATLGQLAALAPWLARLAAADAAWRPLLIVWTDVMSERLTLPRYVDPGHRRRHAKAMVARPLAMCLGVTGAGEGASALEAFAECALAFWDLLGAEAGRGIGWNRLDLARGPVVGGFHGLAGQASPPDAQAERLIARELRERLAAMPWEAAAETPAFARRWFSALAERAIAVIDGFLAEGRWPDSAQLPRARPAMPSIWRRLFGASQDAAGR